MTEEANYGVYIGYPKGYISEFNNAHSAMKDENGEVIARFGGRNGTEGQLGYGVQNSPQTVMPIPAKMEVMWFSGTENQFWSGEFELPKNELVHALKDEKILDLFTTRSGSREKKYDQIVVNVAPKGKVYVYLRGIPAKLLATYQAKPIKYDWLKHVDETWAIKGNEIESQDEYVELMKKDYINIFDKVNQYYKEDFFTPVRWKLRIKGDKKILAFAVKTVNGEYTQVFDDPTEQEIKSIPTEIAFDVEEKGKVSRYNFELHHSYEFYKKNFTNTSLVYMLIDIPDPDHAFLYFKQGDKTVEFTDFVPSELDR
ncbi:DUF2931 family protein [Acinetobacter gerneri]|uniref:DUF2931 family protein n=1 Tax=Acinetobacter gerneri TaxID=202952 RepID=UPI002935574D|nr:DUF2931 family protein [Acinetobacter gerneri]MDV2439344.1 DUF2931 family protein [Acinetobacter gerneri]